MASSLKSYLAFPSLGECGSLASNLAQIPYCEVLPASNRDVVILITETPNEAAETALAEQLAAVRNLQFLSLVAAATTEAGDPRA